MGGDRKRIKGKIWLREFTPWAVKGKEKYVGNHEKENKARGAIGSPMAFVLIHGRHLALLAGLTPLPRADLLQKRRPGNLRPPVSLRSGNNWSER